MIARHLPLLAMLTSVALLNCGGSSSETPWPVEPEGATPGPAGESAGRDETELPSEVTDESESPEPDTKGSPDAGVMRTRP